jgi:beige protein homolog 1
LKGDEPTEESLSLFIPAFRSLLDSCASADLLRSLALFITYALHDTRPHKLQKKRSIRFDARMLRFPNPIDRTQTSLTKPKVGIEILRMYSAFLCSPDDVAAIRKFARAVTNKVGKNRNSAQNNTLTQRPSVALISHV